MDIAEVCPTPPSARSNRRAREYGPLWNSRGALRASRSPVKSCPRRRSWQLRRVSFSRISAKGFSREVKTSVLHWPPGCGGRQRGIGEGNGSVSSGLPGAGAGPKRLGRARPGSPAKSLGNWSINRGQWRVKPLREPRNGGRNRRGACVLARFEWRRCLAPPSHGSFS